jgi:hypothetical protein
MTDSNNGGKGVCQYNPQRQPAEEASDCKAIPSRICPKGESQTQAHKAMSQPIWIDTFGGRVTFNGSFKLQRLRL